MALKFEILDRKRNLMKFKCDSQNAPIPARIHAGEKIINLCTQYDPRNGECGVSSIRCHHPDDVAPSIVELDEKK